MLEKEGIIFITVVTFTLLLLVVQLIFIGKLILKRPKE